MENTNLSKHLSPHFTLAEFLNLDKYPDNLIDHGTVL